MRIDLSNDMILAPCSQPGRGAEVNCLQDGRSVWVAAFVIVALGLATGLLCYAIVRTWLIRREIRRRPLYPPQEWESLPFDERL